MKETLDQLKTVFHDSEDIWFYVTFDYRIQFFNQKAVKNSRDLHGRAITAGDSILDFARDTNNRVDDNFIACFGKAASGTEVNDTQLVQYNNANLNTTTTYTPVYERKKVIGVSILVRIEELNSPF